MEHSSTLNHIARVKSLGPVRAFEVINSLPQLLLWIDKSLFFCVIGMTGVLFTNICKTLRLLSSIEPSSTTIWFLFTLAYRSWRHCSLSVFDRWSSWIFIILSCRGPQHISEVGVLTYCRRLCRRVKLLIVLPLLLEMNWGWKLLGHLLVSNIPLLFLKYLQVSSMCKTLSLAIIHWMRMSDNLLILAWMIVVHGLCGITLRTYNERVLSILRLAFTLGRWFVLWFVLICAF